MRNRLRFACTLLLLATFAGVAAADLDPSRTLPPDEVLRLMEEASHLESAGKSDMARAHAHANGGSIVNAEAPHEYDAIHYRLDVKPSRTARHVDGTTTLTAVVVDGGITQVELDAIGMTFSSITVNGTARTTWSAIGGKLFVPICEGVNCPPHAVGDTLVVAVTYSCNPTTGYYYYVRNSYSFVEPFDARYWWPCWDQPADKATLDLYATVPNADSCYSNGVLIDAVPGAPGFRVWHWQETHPIATYLVSVAVAPFWRLNQVAGSVPIVSVAFPEDSTKAKLDYVNVPTMVTTFAGLWGPYPFDKYGQATVDPFGAGGMEHQTMTTLRRSLLRGDRFYEYVWAHELAHQWWGDWVTCVDFRDIWLNEGFATMAEARWVEALSGPAAYDARIVSQMNSALSADANFRYAIYDPPPGQTFGTTIYMKGGCVLHMLRRILGDAVFGAGMQLYGQRFAYANATTHDLQQAMEDVSGQPLDWFFDEWIFAAGIPTYDWTWQVGAVEPPSAGLSDLQVDVRQVQTAAPFYKMPIEFKVARSARPDTFVTVWNDAVAQQEFIVRINGAVTGVTFDPRNSILKRLQVGTVAVDGDVAPALPGRIALTVAPNPARGPVVLRGDWSGGVAGAEPGAARFVVFDASGRVVRDLGAIARPGGSGAGSTAPFAVTWDRRDDAGSRVPPGLYFAQVTVAGKREARPVVVVP